MAKIFAAQNLPADVSQVMDQLERHCLAPDGSLISKSTYYDLQLAREEMCKERQRYLEALAVYIEAIAMVEEYQQAVSVATLGGIRDVQGLYPQLGLRSLPQVYEALEHRMVVAEAAQRLRLPLISKDGEIHEEEIEKWSIVSRSSLDSTSTSATISSSTNSTNYTNVSAIGAGAPANNPFSVGVTDASEPEVGGVPNRFLGITPAYLWQTQLQQAPLSMDFTEYQVLLAREIASRLDAKCDKLADAVVIDDIDSSTSHQSMTSRLPERVKLIIEEIEREELAWREDLYSSDRKFAEYYNVLEQILGVLIKLVKDVKLRHQHKYDELQKTWLCKRCETMSAKLRVLEHILLLETYTRETIPALHKIRKYLVESTEEASLAYNKAGESRFSVSFSPVLPPNSEARVWTLDHLQCRQPSPIFSGCSSRRFATALLVAAAGESYRMAAECARNALLEKVVDNKLDAEKFKADLMKIAMTTLSSKILSQDKEHFAKLAVDAVMRLKGSTNLESIQIIKKPGGSLKDSYLDEGFILDKKIGVGQPKRIENAKILVANTAMDTDKVKIYGARVRVDSMAKVAEIEVAEKEKMREKVQKIINHGINCFVNRQLIYNFPEELFADAGVLAIEHADFDGIERLALVTGGEIASTFDNPESVKLGHCKLIEEIMIGEDKLIHFSGVEMGQACTIVLRGASPHMLDEAERSLHDALCVLSQTVNDSRVLLGGGWPEMVMAKAVDELARKTPGKRSHAIEAFSRALVAIPTIIADNAGLDSAELVAQLRAEHHKEGSSAGIDVISGSVGDMAELGISEAFKVKQAVLLSATEAAEMILRVDEIITCAPRRREDRM